MIFEFSSELSIKDTTIILQHLKSHSVTIKNFEGNEGKCSQCLTPIKPGERALVLYDTIMHTDGLELNDEIYIVHVKNPAGNLCLEEFISRLLNKPSLSEDQSVSSTAGSSISSPT